MAVKVYEEPLPYTYEVGIDEPVHPDPSISFRFNEYAMSDCEYGCKIYKDPLSGVKVLAHMKMYGCRKLTKEN